MEHASSIHIGARKQRSGGINEDSVATAVLENHHRDDARPVGVFVLGDGVGGAAGGDVASFLLTSVVRERLVAALSGPATDRPGEFGVDALDEVPTVDDRPDDTEAWLRETVQDAVDEAHGAIQDYAEEAGGRPATTAVVAVYLDGTLHYAWAGDSRLYLVNGDEGAIQQLTEDHAVTNRLLEEGEIDDEAYARVHPDATAITNAVGGSPYGEPTVDLEFGTADVYAEDRILLTSDGLIDAFPNVGPLREDYERADGDEREAVVETITETLVTDDEIRDVVLSAPDLATAAADLITFANDRGGKDNLSVTLARDPEAPETPTVLPKRGIDAADPLADRETVIESGGDDGNGEDGAEESADAGGSTDAGRGDPDPDGGRSRAAGVDRGEESRDGGLPNDAPDADAPADDPNGPDDAGEDGGVADARDGPLDVVALSDHGAAAADEPTAAVAIEGHGRLYEVADGFTVGRGVEGADENPNLGLVLDDAAVEQHHARFERDGVAGYWRLRDRSETGTCVRPPGEGWHRIRAGGEREAHRLADGTELTLQSPDEDPVTLQFFTSVESAQQQARDRSAGDDDGRF